MTQKKPVIGYTTRDKFFDPLQWLISLSIKSGGGKPLRLSSSKTSYTEKIDGLVIGGGTDLYPAMYEFDPKPDYEYDHERDEMEIKWLNIAERNSLPILGICRGAQLLNVHRGGTLHVDIEKVYENAKYPSHLFANIFFRKEIDIYEDSLLYKCVGKKQVNVNSMHKQSINDLGQGLSISATENNGIVQAIEDKNLPFYMGVQFHPEALVYQEDFKKIFKTLVRCCGSNN